MYKWVWIGFYEWVWVPRSEVLGEGATVPGCAMAILGLGCARHLVPCLLMCLQFATVDRGLDLDSSPSPILIAPRSLPSLTLRPRCPLALQGYLLDCIPTIHYIPDFLDEEEEVAILGRIRDVSDGKWTVLQQRRLQEWGVGSADSGGLVSETMPSWLSIMCDLMVETGVFPAEYAPNHVLVNEYAGAQGIMPHCDGPCYRPVVAIISLQDTVLMGFRPRLDTEAIGTQSSQPIMELVLRPRSLLIFQDEAFTSYMHGIDAVSAQVVGASAPVANARTAHCSDGDTIVRGTRLSLTIRHKMN